MLHEGRYLIWFTVLTSHVWPLQSCSSKRLGHANALHSFSCVASQVGYSAALAVNGLVHQGGLGRVTCPFNETLQNPLRACEVFLGVQYQHTASRPLQDLRKIMYGSASHVSYCGSASHVSYCSKLPDMTFFIWEIVT